MWYEIYAGANGYDVYEVTGNGQHYTLKKRYKSKASADSFAKRAKCPVRWK